MTDVAEPQIIWHPAPMVKGSKLGTGAARQRKSPSNMAGMERPDVTRRLVVLGLAFKNHYRNPSLFAEHAGLSYNQWNNVHKQGYPLSKEIAFKLVRAFPGLTTDWLWFGHRQGLSHEMDQRLEAASRTLNGTTEAG